MSSEYIPKVNEKIEYFDKKYNYQKKQQGVVTKVTNKFVFLKVPESDVVTFEKTDAFENNKPINSLQQGDKIRFKKTIRQKEYYEGVIKNIGDNALEIEYYSEKKIEPLLLEQNFSIDKLKKSQELHGDKIQGSVYEKRLDNLLKKSEFEIQAKLAKSIKLYTKDEVFPKIDVLKEIDKKSKPPSAILYLDLIQKNFSANNCKTKFNEIEKQDQCNQFYEQFANNLYTELLQTKNITEIESVLKEFRSIYQEPILNVTGNDYLSQMDLNQLRESYRELFEINHPDKKGNEYAFNYSNEISMYYELRRLIQSNQFIDYKKYTIPSSIVKEVDKLYANKLKKHEEVQRKYNAYSNKEFIETLSDNFRNFIFGPSRKDQKTIDDIVTIASLENNFSNELLSQREFNNYSFSEEDPAEYDSINSFVKDYAISKQINDYMEGKGGVKTKLNDVLKILKSKDENLEENRFNLNSLSINELDQKIQDEFGLRAIQYGITVKEGADNYKHDLLELIYGSMKDLAKATNLDPVYLGLGETKSNIENDKKINLGLAIGARGQGNALAHYEPDENVINLTKARGNGALAHEWGHAFDKFMRKSLNDPQRIEKAIKNYKEMQKTVTVDDILKNHPKYVHFLHKYSNDSLYTPTAHVREMTLSQAKGDVLIKGYENHPISQDFENLIYGIRYSEFCKTGKKIDPKYLGSNEECFARGFQSYVADKTNNRYLAMDTNEETILNDEEIVSQIGVDDVLLRIYPQSYEREYINDLFENVFRHKKELQSIIDMNKEGK